MYPRGIGPKNAKRIGRVLSAWETGRLNQVEQPPADALGGPVFSYIGKTTEDIDARDADVPGSGDCDIYQLDSTGNLVALGYSETAYNLGASSIASGTYVDLSLEPNSGNLVASPFSASTTSSSGTSQPTFSSYMWSLSTSQTVYAITGFLMQWTNPFSGIVPAANYAAPVQFDNNSFYSTPASNPQGILEIVSSGAYRINVDCQIAATGGADTRIAIGTSLGSSNPFTRQIAAFSYVQRSAVSSIPGSLSCAFTINVPEITGNLGGSPTIYTTANPNVFSEADPVQVFAMLTATVAPSIPSCYITITRMCDAVL